MGLDVDVHFVVGALVKDEEVFLRSQKVHFMCNRCEADYAAKQRFCGQCGFRFALVEVKAWVPSVAAYIERHDVKVDPEDVDDRLFHNVATLQSSEDRDGATLAVGVRFAGPSMEGRYSSGPKSIGFARLESARAQVNEILAEMGLTPREVSLFPVMYVSC